MTDKTDDAPQAPHVRYFHMGQWPCYVGFTTSEEAFDAEMKRLNITPPPAWIATPHSAATAHYFTNRDMLTIIVCIRRERRRSREQVAALLAHESLHVVQQMEQWFYPSGRFDDESAAYLLQYLVQSFLYEYSKPGEGSSRSVEPCRG